VKCFGIIIAPGADLEAFPGFSLAAVEHHNLPIKVVKIRTQANAGSTPHTDASIYNSIDQ
jgi:hypothetical protein